MGRDRPTRARSASGRQVKEGWNVVAVGTDAGWFSAAAAATLAEVESTS